MNISPLLAQKIVNNMKEIIHQDLNFIDRDGTIIASTNPLRIGTFHDAGRLVVEKGEPVLIDDNNQHLYKNCKAGINMPVNYDNEVIASIGITGPINKVGIYGDIIRRMTEILILEEEIQSLRQRDEEHIRIQFEDLLFYPQHIQDNWTPNAKSIWFNQEYKNILIIEPQNNKETFFKVARNQITQYIAAGKQTNRDSLLFMERENTLIILYKESIKKIIESYLHLFTQLSEKRKESLIIAFGSPTQTKFKDSYENARLALHASKRNPSKASIQIKYYDELTLDLLLPPQTLQQQKYFKNKVLSNLSEKDLDEFLTIIELFETHNGSITHIAEEMYIHKNTLQYKIQKLKNLTGYDLRNFHDFMILRLASLIQDKT